MMEELSGGRENSIYLDKSKVHRPSGVWSTTIQALLVHLESEGFLAAPKAFGFDNDGNEVVSYVEGDVYNYPLTGNIASDHALASAAKLLRKYHEASSSFLTKNNLQPLTWMLPRREPAEVICHGDFAPYNVALKGTETIGVIDFDTAHPAPIVWDLAYAVYCWAPLKTDQHDAMGDLETQAKRAKQFCDAYGLSVENRKILVSTMIERIQYLVDFMHAEAKKGNEAFIANIKDGHHLGYLADIEYLELNAKYITELLLNDVARN